MLDGYYYCLNCHSEITPDYNEHCCFCGSAAVDVSGDYSPEEVETAFDLLNKQQQGLVIVPPCKVGDTVYIPWHWNNKNGIAFAEVEEIKIYDSNNHYMFLIDLQSDDEEFNQSFGGWKIGKSIGETVFLTREEAEQALKEGAGNG